MSGPFRLAVRFVLPLCIVMPFSTARAATPAELTAKFAQLDGDGWTGADASWSARLPDGRTVWLFGDTFIGGVDQTGRRDPATPLVRNSMVVEGRDGRLRTLQSTALVEGATDDDWYWPGPPVVGKLTLQVPMAHIVRTGPGPWDFRADGTSLAVFSLPDLKLRSLTRLATPPGVNMASAAITTKRFTYVYGTYDGDRKKRAYVARTAAAELRGEWHYWDGSGWSPDASAAVAVLSGVSNQFSVVHSGRGWTLVTQVPLSRAVVAFRSISAHGRWRSLGTIAQLPVIDRAITYNATLHPEHSSAGKLVLGYNVNGADIDAVHEDASLYRPRFMSIELAGLD